MSSNFNQRAFGCAIVKAINANYNADFTHQPRTLPDGTAYATDKALKYLVRNYWVDHLKEEYVLYYKRLNEEMNPFDLDEAYTTRFDKIGTEKNEKNKVLRNLLSCIDVRTFGATFANKKGNKMGISIHGPLQFTHGVNRFPESDIVTEQIMSPFRDDKAGKSEDSQATTLGTQHKLAEGHYVHHISLNPTNLIGHLPVGYEGFPTITQRDVAYVKQALCRGATYYDSAAKAGIDNELLLWVTLKEGSQMVLPSFVSLVEIDKDRTINLAKIKDLLARDHIKEEIETIELFYDKQNTKVINPPSGALIKDILEKHV